MATTPKLLLDFIYDHETSLRDRVYLTQPLGQGRVQDYTWGQTLDQARRMAAHLQSLGLVKGDKVAILSKNCAHFFMAELAIWIGGFTTVAIFPTENAETVRYVLEHSESKAIFVGKLDVWDQQAPGVDASLHRISFPLAPQGTPHATGESWDRIIARTAPLTGRLARDPKDLAMIIYTSGSTGQPKGVMHSFERISAAAVGISRHLSYSVQDRTLSYLPLAHVFERAYIECGSFVVGGHVFFAEAIDTFVQDLQRARPTLFISVPRLWLKFQHGVYAKLPPKKLSLLMKVPVVRTLISKKILKGLGLDQVRLAGSGSAPIPAELIQWYRNLGLNLLEGYAMTEDFAYSHLSSLEKNAPGYVGLPYPGVEVRLSDEGEVLIKSLGQMVGYYKRPDLDAESFTPDGFFRTGDKGERRADGLLKLTGRVKELFKTSKGKYVAPAPIENRLNEHPSIELSCVSGVGQPAAYGLVVLSEDLRKRFKEADSSALGALKSEVEQEFKALLERVNSQIPDYEHLQMLVIAAEPFTIENGLLTPTMKLKRARIEETVKPALESWYGAKKPVVWAS